MTAGAPARERPQQASGARSAPARPSPPPEPTRAAPPAPAPEPKPATATPAPTADVDVVWDRVCEAASGSAAGSALLDSLRLVAIEGGVAVIEPRDKAQLGRARNRRAWLTELLGNAVGGPVRVELREPSPKEEEAANPGEDDASLRRRAENDPMVRRAMELFDARVVRIEPAPASRRSDDQRTSEDP